MKLHTLALAFALALVITGLCASSIVWAQGTAATPADAGRTLQIQTRGDAAARPRVTLQVIKTVCGSSAITWYQQGDSGARITCPLAQPVQTARQQRYTHLDFSYLSQPPGGMAAVALGGAGCDAGTWVSVAGKAVLLRQGCGTRSQRPTGKPSTAPLSTLNRGPADKPWNTVFQTAPLPLPQDTAEASTRAPGQAPKQGS
ncbi:MAG TPA: hypothetical protein VFL86_12195 [Burkholderiaceae bacterium]|nr:hypothetical protein [Burkholderiaceae bacterium]